MIHEALFYLWNNDGEVDGGDALENEWTDLVELREFLHPGEKELLRKIARVAVKFRKIESFAGAEIEREGLYLKATREGIGEVLYGYREEIVRLEGKLLKNPQLSLSYVLGCVEKFATLLGVLDSMVGIVEGEDVRGCLLLGRLHKFLNGVDETSMTATRDVILKINVTFYTQLSDWVIYGDFTDNYGEFFVRNAGKPNSEFLYQEQFTSERPALLGKRSKIKRPPAVWHFYLQRELLPVNVPLEIAETLLFMGTVVWIIRNEPTRANSSEKYNLQQSRDVWEGGSAKYYAKIKSLEREPFNLQAFNGVIEECRVKLTKYLWNLFVVEADLSGHLQIIRDYYCLGRGELFQQFIIVGENYLKDTGERYIVQNLNFIFTDEARKMYSGNYKLYKKFELSLMTTMMAAAEEREKGNEVGIVSTGERLWNFLEINFDIPWPLHVVFHPKAMCLYNKVFNFLLRLKKTHIALRKLWFSHMSSKNKVDSHVWTLRHQLMFMVNTLQYYFQVDAIEAQFSLLQEAVRNANAFEDIIALHNHFLTDLLGRTFVMDPEMLNSTASAGQHHFNKTKHQLYRIPNLNYEAVNPVHECILDLLRVCENFCRFAGAWGPRLVQLDLDDLERCCNETDAVVERLMFVLNFLRKKTGNKHLLQLLLQLNYNNWFCKQKSDFNLMSSSASGL